MAVMTLSAAMAEIKANPGKFYTYILRRPDGSPFYVGMGKDRRIRAHEKNAEGRNRGHKFSIIRKILTNNADVGYEIQFVDSRAEAIAQECRLIALYGRLSAGTGPLTNLTDGGDGGGGMVWVLTPARAAGAQRAAEKNRGRKLTAEHKAKIGAAGRGREVSAGTRAKMSAIFLGRKLSEEHRAKMSAARMGRPPANKGQPRSESSKAKMSAAKRGRQPSANLLAGGARWRKENAALLSANRKALWADPEYRKMMKSRRWPNSKDNAT